VKSISARFQRHVYDCARLPAIFRRRIFLDIEFLDRIDGQDRGGIAHNPCAVNNALTGKGLAVEQAVDEVGIVLSSQAVGTGGRETASRVPHHARTQLQQVLVIAAIQGQVVDLLIAERPPQCRRCDVNEGNFS
jgi:hypothetical protein